MLKNFSKKSNLLLLLLTITAITPLLSSCGGCCTNNVSGGVGFTAPREGGSITVEIRNIPKPSTGRQFIDIAVSGSLVFQGQGQGRTSFTQNKTYEVKPSSIDPAPLFTKDNLYPGQWKVSASGNNWNASGNLTFGARASKKIIFTYGSGNVIIE